MSVRWVDSISRLESAWIDPSTVTNALPVITTVGRVLMVDKAAVTVTASWSELDSGEVGGVITIPRCAVVGVAQLC